FSSVTLRQARRLGSSDRPRQESGTGTIVVKQLEAQRDRSLARQPRRSAVDPEQCTVDDRRDLSRQTRGVSRQLAIINGFLNRRAHHAAPPCGGIEVDLREAWLANRLARERQPHPPELVKLLIPEHPADKQLESLPRGRRAVEDALGPL